jgi:hypothetical protein
MARTRRLARARRGSRGQTGRNVGCLEARCGNDVCLVPYLKQESVGEIAQNQVWAVAGGGERQFGGIMANKHILGMQESREK